MTTQRNQRKNTDPWSLLAPSPVPTRKSKKTKKRENEQANKTSFQDFGNCGLFFEGQIIKQYVQSWKNMFFVLFVFIGCSRTGDQQKPGTDRATHLYFIQVLNYFLIFHYIPLFFNLHLFSFGLFLYSLLSFMTL